MGKNGLLVPFTLQQPVQRPSGQQIATDDAAHAAFVDDGHGGDLVVLQPADHIEDGRVLGYTALFVGIAPLSDPRLVVLVTADLPRTDHGTPYGSQVAAPAVKSVLERSLRLLGVPSDVR